MLKVIAFDLFGTVFDLSKVDRAEISAYVKQLRQDVWQPLELPESWGDIQPHPDAKEGIQLLRKQYEVITFSNCPLDLQRHLLAKAGIEFQFLFPLENYHIYKPNEIAYKTLSRYYFAVKPEEIMVVSANKTFGDIEGARAAGMKSCLIRNGEPNTIIDLACQLGISRDS
jgi:2-haloalkanoic acid dehalogenase type II